MLADNDLHITLRFGSNSFQTKIPDQPQMPVFGTPRLKKRVPSGFNICAPNWASFSVEERQQPMQAFRGPDPDFLPRCTGENRVCAFP
jgi:hypothetical protein